MPRLWIIITALLPIVLSGCEPRSAGPEPEQPDWSAILEGEHRAEEHRARDVYRNPRATLDFFEVDPCHTVVEIWPGAGWYTEILAPLTRDCGTLYAAHFNPEREDVEYMARVHRAYREKLAAEPRIYDQLEVTVFDPPEHTDIAPVGSVDRVLTFRSVHGWLRAGSAAEAFDAFFRVLKPGGILGVVTHRAPEGTDRETMVNTGYVTESMVRELAERAGFELVASSDINANPRDGADHPAGVWTLPPTLRLGEENREQYLDIGESDRMTLKFRKPEDHE